MSFFFGELTKFIKKQNLLNKKQEKTNLKETYLLEI